jgi:aminopeptidase YwaD
LQRAAFIGAASALFLANLKASDVAPLWAAMESASLRRAATMLDRRVTLSPADGAALTRSFLSQQHEAFESIATFVPIPDSVRLAATRFFQRLEALTGAPEAAPPATGEGGVVFARNAAVAGPMVVFGYDYLADHTRGRAAPRLLEYRGLRGNGDEYAYEVLNFVDGKRTTREIRDAVSSEYGPVDVGLVADYLRALESAGVVRAAK